MKKLKVLVDMPVYEPILKKIEAMAEVDLHLINPPAEDERELPEAMIRDCDFLFCSCLPVNHRQMEKLRVVQIASVGFSQLYGCALNERKIRACNALGVQDVPIGEWNIAMMINLQRDMPAMIQHQEQSVWDRDKRFQREIYGSTVGIWGYGGIGQQTARLAKNMGLEVRVLTRDGKFKARGNCYRVPGTGDPDGVFFDKIYSLAEKKQFLAGLDFLILAIPLTPENTGIIGMEELSMLPGHACILNPARGPLIQEKPLITALQNGTIKGAALDTHYYYPMPPEHPFWKMNNVILTPHISGSSSSNHFLERIWEIFYQNLQRELTQQPLLNALTEKQLDGK